MTSESASARVRCRDSFTPGMNLLLYNDSQRNQDTRHRAQTRERLVNALDRHWNCRAHGPPRRPHHHTQQSAWLCTWRTPQNIAPRVGKRSKTRIAELERRDAAQAQAAHARWPPSPDVTEDIQELTRELKLCDVPRNVHKELQRVLPSVEEEEIIRTPRQPPAAGLMTRHQDTCYIPPPRAVGGARGNSAPVSTATLGLIQRQDPSLAGQLREDPALMMTQATRHKVYSTMRLIRAGMLGQLASLQQWEEAMRRQDKM